MVFKTHFNLGLNDMGSLKFVKWLIKLNRNQTYVDDDSQHNRIFGETDLKLSVEVILRDTDHKKGEFKKIGIKLSLYINTY